MGFFSWLTCDTGRSISNCHSKRGVFDVFLLIPKELGGGYLVEKFYCGYGIFANEDIFALCAIWNAPKKCNGKTENELRNIGISLAGNDRKNAGLTYPIKLAEHPIAYEEAPPSKICPHQGFFMMMTDF